MKAATGTALIVSGQDAIIARPDRKHAVQPPLMICHSGGGTPFGATTSTGFSRHVRALVDQLGMILGGVKLGNQFWGDATSQSRLRTTRTVLQASPYNAAAGLGAALATSQGLATALSVAASHRDEIGCVIALCGVSHLDDVRDNDRGPGSKSLIESAWGIGPSDPLPANANPNLRTTDLAGLPFLAFYATDDPYDPGGARVQALAAAIGGTAVSVGALGHTDTAIGAASTDQIVAFVGTALA